MFEEFKIISGGQSGADIGGIIFAQIYGIDHGVNTHKGFKPIRGEIPKNVKVNYVTERMGIEGLRYRTEYNVKNSDITLIFVQKDLNKTKGSKLTAKYCFGHDKPYIVIKVLKNLINFEDKDIEYDYICEYINKNKERLSIDLHEILYHLNLLKDDKMKEGRGKLIINIAGERYWDENEIVKILENIFK